MGIELIPMEEVRARSVRWLWPETLALGKLTLLAGDPGLGKSFITMDIAARVTRGGPWPFTKSAGSRRRAKGAGGVLIASAEDDAADTIRPRLDAAGADLSRVQLLCGVRRGEAWDDFNLEDHLGLLGEAIESVAGARLLIIDPISAYLPRIDSNNNTQVRSVLKALSDLAGAHQVAVIAVSHLRKNTQGPMAHQTIGSLAFTAAARSVWVAKPLRASGGEEGARALVPVKSNLHTDAEALVYCVEEGRVEWLRRAPAADLEARALPAERAARDAEATRDACCAFLREALAGGAVAVNDLRAACAERGLAWNTVRQFASAADARSERRDGTTWWSLRKA